jgi:ATP-dependent DNA ligase
MVWLYSRNAYDWTARLTAIAAAAELIKAKSFTIDGEAKRPVVALFVSAANVVCSPDQPS